MYPGEAAGAEQFAHSRPLIIAVLEQQPAFVQQMLRRLGDDLADIVEAIATRDQRALRLETHVALAQVRIAGRDIRRIADDHPEASAIESGEPVAAAHLDVLQEQPLAIALGQRHGLFHAVHRSHRPQRPFAGQGQGDGAGAGAQVEHRSGIRREGRQRGFHQQFGVRARDQCVWRDLQVQAPEALVAKYVGHRLAVAPTGDPVVEPLVGLARHDALRPGTQEAARLAHRRRQQQLGVEPGAGRIGQLGILEKGTDSGHVSRPGPPVDRPGIPAAAARSPVPPRPPSPRPGSTG